MPEEEGQPRRHAEVTITVTITGEEVQTYTADTTTTGNIYRAAGNTLETVSGDARHWLTDMKNAY